MAHTRHWFGTVAIAAAFGACLTPSTPAAAQSPDQAFPAATIPGVLPRPDADFHFPGNVGRTYLDSDPAPFPQPVQAPKGAPNIVRILIDDAGFGQFSSFGGAVPSPTTD